MSQLSSIESFAYSFGTYQVTTPADLGFAPSDPSSDSDYIERPTFSYAALSLDCFDPASPLFFAGVEGQKGNIRGQIAVKLTLDAMVATALKHSAALGGDAIVQAAFKEANQQVYQYGHRMASGGSIGATGFVVVFDGDKVCMAKVGGSAGFLWRGGKLLPFYEGDSMGPERGGTLQRFIGANSQILVDLANVHARKRDTIIITTDLPAGAEYDEWTRSASQILSEKGPVEYSSAKLAQEIARLTLLKHSGQHVGRHSGENSKLLDHNISVFMLQLGQPTIVLTDIVSELE